MAPPATETALPTGPMQVLSSRPPWRETFVSLRVHNYRLFAGSNLVANTAGVAPVTDPNNGLVFPNFDATPNPLLQTNLIFPVPCEFINASLPHCAVIRPTAQGQIDAVGAANALTASGLFIGQPQSFIQLLLEMAIAADSAVRAR